MSKPHEAPCKCEACFDWLLAANNTLQQSVDENDEFMAYMYSELDKFTCCCENHDINGTAPMFWPEFISCVGRKAYLQGQESVKTLTTPTVT